MFIRGTIQSLLLDLHLTCQERCPGVCWAVRTAVWSIACCEPRWSSRCCGGSRARRGLPFLRTSSSGRGWWALQCTEGTTRVKAGEAGRAQDSAMISILVKVTKMFTILNTVTQNTLNMTPGLTHVVQMNVSNTEDSDNCPGGVHGLPGRASPSP